MSTQPNRYEAWGALGEATPDSGGRAHSFSSVDAVGPLQLMHGLTVRAIHGDRVTLAVVELASGLHMPEHRHANEQVGVVVRGDFRFSIGGETRQCRAGDNWVIPAGVPHTVEAVGDDGCTVVETFSPPRGDWQAMPQEAPSRGRWPER